MMSKLGRAIRATGAVRTFKDGSATSFVWRWWHPLSWIIAPLLLLIQGIFTGFPDAWRHKYYLGFGLSPYWQQRRNEIEWGTVGQ